MIAAVISTETGLWIILGGIVGVALAFALDRHWARSIETASKREAERVELIMAHDHQVAREERTSVALEEEKETTSELEARLSNLAADFLNERQAKATAQKQLATKTEALEAVRALVAKHLERTVMTNCKVHSDDRMGIAFSEDVWA